MNPYENDTLTTIIVKHLPEFITTSNELKSKYFKPYKPIDVRFMQSPSMAGFVFLDFFNRSKAEEAFEQLKNINFGLYYKRVVVEYAKPDPNRQQPIEPVKMTLEQREQAADPISPAQGILYPPNPHLRYFYPDPTPEILTNISNAIGTVPRFYTQVLHLMNKYNMPPPFGPADKESITTLLKRKRDDLLASDESELEDEEDSGKISKETEIQEKKVKQARLERIAAEKQKLATASTTTTATLPMNNKTAPTNKIKINIGSHHKKELTESQKSIRDKCIAETEREKLPAFKNYQRGTLSNKLYIKNLAKQVTEVDLNTLYSNFSQDIQINLMKKGKLRGQAFITFPQEDIANTALDCTNGYMLYDRPIAVLFGKPAALVNE